MPNIQSVAVRDAARAVAAADEAAKHTNNLQLIAWCSSLETQLNEPGVSHHKIWMSVASKVQRETAGRQ